MMKESQFCIPVHNPLLCFPHHVNKRPQPSVQTPLMAACSIYKVLERERDNSCWFETAAAVNIFFLFLFLQCFQEHLRLCFFFFGFLLGKNGIWESFLSLPRLFFLLYKVFGKWESPTENGKKKIRKRREKKKRESRELVF